MNMMLDAGAILMGMGALAMFAGFFLTAEYKSVPDKEEWGPTAVIGGTSAVIAGVIIIGIHAVATQAWQ